MNKQMFLEALRQQLMGLSQNDMEKIAGILQRND